MPLPEVATPAANPAPAPAAPAQGTPAPAAVTEAPQAEPQVKTFFSKKKEAEKPAEAPPDFSKSPDLEKAYKSMQGDYTRKTQELAEMRKSFEGEQATLKAEREAMQRNHDALMEALRGRTQQPTDGQPANPQDPMSQVQALRNEGRYEEADKMFLDLARKVAEDQVAPIKQAAKVQELVATFTNVATQAREMNPVVKEHWNDVQAVWDSNTPQIQLLRNIVLSSPQNMQTFVPLVFESIAKSRQLDKVEPAYEAALSKIAQLEAKLGTQQARRVPPSLVTTSQVSRETSGGGGGLNGAMERAQQKLSQGA
jgi:hypothetical protein